MIGRVDAVQITIAKTKKGQRRASMQEVRLIKDGQVMTFEKSEKSKKWNQIAFDYANAGNIEDAEKWVEKLDARHGFKLEIRTLNAIMLAYVKRGDFEKADDWMKKLENPSGLYCEIGATKPDAESFHYMCGWTAEAGQLGLAEWHFDEIENVGVIPELRTYMGMIRGCIKAGQVRRGHKWGKTMVQTGCAECLGALSPSGVLEVRNRIAQDSSRSNCDNEFIKNLDTIISELAKALADVGHTRSANEWLGYLVKSGLRIQDAADTWEYVRAVHPVDIIPSILSGEIIEPSEVPNASVGTSCALHENYIDGSTGPSRPRSDVAVKPPALKPRPYLLAKWKRAPPMFLPAKLSGEVTWLTPSLPRVVAKEGADTDAVRRLHDEQEKKTLELANALAEAQEAGVDEEDLQTARTTLLDEERRTHARAKLVAFKMEAVDLNALREAIREAEAVGVEIEVIAAAQALAHQLARRLAAKQRLEDCMALRSSAAFGGHNLVLPPITPRQSNI